MATFEWKFYNTFNWLQIPFEWNLIPCTNSCRSILLPVKLNKPSLRCLSGCSTSFLHGSSHIWLSPLYSWSAITPIRFDMNQSHFTISAGKLRDLCHCSCHCLEMWSLYNSKLHKLLSFYFFTDHLLLKICKVSYVQCYIIILK